MIIDKEHLIYNMSTGLFTTIFGICLVCLQSCGGDLQNRQTTTENAATVPDSKVQTDKRSREALISIIENSDCFYGKMIGITGNPSSVHEAYEELRSFADDSLWLRLSFSKSVVMRLYAYRALEGNEQLREQLQLRYLNDSSEVCIRISDTETNIPLAKYLELIK